jgi:predicted O-methyltransferase YrrM
VLARLFEDGTVTATSDGTIHAVFPVAVSWEEGAALRDLVVAEDAVHTVEIGLGYGVSALFVCEGLLANGDPDARHVAIDAHQSARFADCGRQLLAEAGVAHLVELHPERSEIVLPRFLAEGRTFDLAFVDGNHRFDGVFLDLVYLGRLLRPGGVVMLDDHQLPAVARAAAFFTTNLGWAVEAASPPGGDHEWVALRTAREPDTRPFDFYVEF